MFLEMWAVREIHSLSHKRDHGQAKQLEQPRSLVSHSAAQTGMVSGVISNGQQALCSRPTEEVCSVKPCVGLTDGFPSPPLGILCTAVLAQQSPPHHSPEPCPVHNLPPMLCVSPGMALPAERNWSLQKKWGSQNQRKWHSPAALPNLSPPAAIDPFCPQLPPRISRLGMQLHDPC